MRALLDVNVLVALLDRQHVAHVKAHTWLGLHLQDGWASCPMTENGVVRILCNPRYPAPVAASDVIARLKTAQSSPHHEFWADDISLVTSRLVNPSALRGHLQVTDIYLLALAAAHGGVLVTFDQSIAAHTVPGARPEQLVVLR